MTITFGTHRLRRYDARNWLLEELRAPRSGRGAQLAKDAAPRWRSCDCYFQSLGRALEYVYEHKLIADDADVDLVGAIERVEAIAKELRENVEVAA